MDNKNKALVASVVVVSIIALALVITLILVLVLPSTKSNGSLNINNTSLLSESQDAVTIAVINESTVVSDQDVITAMNAVQKQITNDLFPAWKSFAFLVFFSSSESSSVPTNYFQMVVLDNSDQGDTLIIIIFIY
jgi:hypothetical protein